MKIMAIFIIFGFSYLVSVSDVFAGNDSADGFEWASVHEVHDKSGCYQLNGEPLRESQEFTNGCLDFIGEKSVLTNDRAPSEGNSPFAEEESVPPAVESARISNNDFISDGLPNN